MRLEFHKVNADTKSISPRLIFTLVLQNESSEDATFFNFFGEVHAADAPKVLGKLIPEPFDPVAASGDSKSLIMNLDLDIHKINIIEELRKGQDLLIKLYVSTIYCFNHIDIPFKPTDIKIGHIDVQQKGQGDRIKIPQSEWVKILENLNYGNYKIIEMPLPRLPQGTTLDKAIGHLEEARRKFNGGEYDDVLVDCRDAVEEIHSVLRTIEKKDKSLRDKFTDVLGSEKERRVEDLMKYFRLYADLGGHKVISNVKDIDRTDAELAMLCAHQLVYFYAKRLVKASQM